MATNINLLPWRAELREQKKKEFLAILGASALVGVFIFAVWYLALAGLVDHQKQRNTKIENEISLLEKKVSEIAELKKQRTDMLDRIKVIQSLQGTRPLIVHIFDELVNKLPDGVFFSRVERKDDKILISGTAESNNRVSTLMRDMNNSDWLKNSVLTKVQANPTFGEQGTDFDVSVDVVLPENNKKEGEK
ncbi:MAG: PilN domain-containing protein [Pseudomonadales bacterium]